MSVFWNHFSKFSSVIFPKLKISRTVLKWFGMNLHRKVGSDPESVVNGRGAIRHARWDERHSDTGEAFNRGGLARDVKSHLTKTFRTSGEALSISCGDGHLTIWKELTILWSHDDGTLLVRCWSQMRTPYAHQKYSTPVKNVKRI